MRPQKRGDTLVRPPFGRRQGFRRRRGYHSLRARSISATSALRLFKISAGSAIRRPFCSFLSCAIDPLQNLPNLTGSARGLLYSHRSFLYIVT